MVQHLWLPYWSWWVIWSWVETREASWFFLPLWMHCKGWCTGWKQWHNLSALVDGWWLRWWNCTGYKLSALALNKKCQKLCNNNTATKNWQDGYNTSYKFDYIWKWLIHNVNFITKHNKLDLCGDHKSWATYIYGEVGACLTGQIANNPGSAKGGYTVLFSDVYCVRSLAYSHRYKFHVKPPVWNVWCKIEVK